MAYWKEQGYLADPEDAREVLRRRGAAVKRGSGASRGKAKGGIKGIFVAAAKLRRVHNAKLKRNL